MSQRSVVHSTFVIERTYDASPERVFAAWASKEAKRQWFGSLDSGDGNYVLEFRVGGHESWQGEHGDSTFTYDATYQDIVENERIVYAYDMHMDGERISVSLATIEFKAAGDGTQLVFTEQGAFLDGLDKPEMREGGTGSLLDKLGEALAREGATA